MGLPEFYQGQIERRTVLSLVESIVAFHQPGLEDKIGKSLGLIDVEPLRKDSVPFLSSRISNVPMLSWPLLSAIKVNQNYFDVDNSFVPADKALQQSAFLEYVTVHEMSHIAFGSNTKLGSLYLETIFKNARDILTPLLEDFANALAVTYLENYYDSVNDSLETNAVLYTHLPSQVNAFKEKPYFMDLLTTCRKRPITTFLDQAKDIGETILRNYELEKESKKKVNEILPLQLTLDF